MLQKRSQECRPVTIVLVTSPVCLAVVVIDMPAHQIVLNLGSEINARLAKHVDIVVPWHASQLEINPSTFPPQKPHFSSLNSKPQMLYPEKVGLFWVICPH